MHIGDIKKHAKLIPILLPGLAVLLVFLPALRFGLVWDDAIFLRDLPVYRQTGDWLAALRPFALSPNYFRPLPLLIFIAELRLGGLNPAIFHGVNLLLHAISASLVAGLVLRAWRLTGRDAILLPIAAGLCYGLHSALIEGVVFISSRFDLLLTMFLLLALLADVGLSGKARPLGVGLAFFLAALSKEMAVAFLLALPLWRLAQQPWSERPRGPGQILRALWQPGDRAVYAVTLLAALAYLGVRYGAIGYLLQPNAGEALTVGNPLQHLLLIGRSLVEYLKLIVWPFTTLTPLHVSPLPLPVASLSGWLSWAILGVALVGLIVVWRRRPRVALLALAALAALLPVSNVLPLELSGGAFIAERFLLFPLALAVLALMAFVQEERTPPSAALAAAGLAWLTLSIATIQLTAPNWHDNLSFWQWAAARAPQSPMPFTNLSLEYNNRGNYRQGIALAQEALVRDADNGQAWNNAGLAFFGLGRFDDAAQAFERAVTLEPRNPLFWNNLAGALREQGKLAEAERMLLDQVLPLSAELPVAYVNLGLVYLRADRPDLAVEALQKALRLLPADAVAEAQELLRQASDPARWLRLGELLSANEEWDKALAAFEQAKTLGAKPVDVAVGIGALRMAQGQWEQAETLLRQTLSEQGGDARLYYYLGLIARQRGDLEQARTLFNQAALLAPDWDLPQQALQGQAP